MGFNQIWSLAIYYRIGLLVLNFISVGICYQTFSILSSHQTSVFLPPPKSNPILPTIDEWMQTATQFHLQVIAYRPFGKESIQLGLQGQYQDLIACLNFYFNKYPAWQWTRILIEEKQDFLRMHWELQR